MDIGSSSDDDMVISRDTEKRQLDKVYSGDESSSGEEEDDMNKSQDGGSPRLDTHHE